MDNFRDNSLQEADETLADLLAQIPVEQREMLLRELDLSDSSGVLDTLMKAPEIDSATTFESEIEGRVDEKSVNKTTPKSSEAFRLTNEEKDFFFGSSSSDSDDSMARRSDGVLIAGNEHEVPVDDDVEVSILEQDAAIYEDVMVSPIIKDSRRLLYMNMCILCTILVVMAIIGFMQSRIIMRMEQNQALLLRSKSPQIEKQQTTVEAPWKFFQLPSDEQRKQLEEKVNSNLVSREEKIYCFTMLATLSYQEGDYQQGRMYLLKGIQLKNED